MKRKKILYLSLTGMTEALGRSQVLEYLIELNKINNISLISFEREEDLENIEDIKKLTKENNIDWNYFIYSNKYGIFSTIIQLFKAVLLGKKIIKEKNINIIHARSMIPATMGYVLKKMYKINLLFDIRGFVVDERIDRKRLKKNSSYYKILKELDNYLYKVSDHIVTLTEEAKQTLHNNLDIKKEKITVIPTCANNKIFKIMPNIETKEFKQSLGFKENDKILIHTGTVLNRYDFEKEIAIFKFLTNKNPNYKFLIVNKGEHEYIKKKFFEHNIETKMFHITTSKFVDVYKYLNIADFSFFLIPPTFAKKAMAPTKFAENVSCNLPTITNNGVGDMEFYMNRYPVGIILNWEQIENNLETTATILHQEIQKFNSSNSAYETLFKNYFDKNNAVEKYDNIYRSLINE